MQVIVPGTSETVKYTGARKRADLHAFLLDLLPSNVVPVTSAEDVTAVLHSCGAVEAPPKGKGAAVPQARWNLCVFVTGPQVPPHVKALSLARREMVRPKHARIQMVCCARPARIQRVFCACPRACGSLNGKCATVPQPRLSLCVFATGPQMPPHGPSRSRSDTGHLLSRPRARCARCARAA